MTRNKKLRSGWTTGACATAATKAAVTALYSGCFPDPVSIVLPGGENPSFSLCRKLLVPDGATVGVIKDAGDDPDVTHGAEVIVTASPGKSGEGVTFTAGEGVGTVTLPGLPVDVGEPAINPVPRRMMTDVVTECAEALSGTPDIHLEVSIPGGDVLAEKTMNGRLGIRGGLSVLGTTGIVRPYSCSAWIHAIHSGVDVARAQGLTHIAAATGKTSEAGVRNLYDLNDSALIDMGDFAGGLFKYLRSHPVPHLSLAGGFAKLCKLGQGEMDLHSSRSRVDFEGLSRLMAETGCNAAQQEKARTANTALEVLRLAGDRGPQLADIIAARARSTALASLSGGVDVEVLVFSREGKLIGRAGDTLS